MAMAIIHGLGLFTVIVKVHDLGHMNPTVMVMASPRLSYIGMEMVMAMVLVLVVATKWFLLPHVL